MAVPGRYLVKGVYHLHDVVKLPLRYHQAQVARRGFEGRSGEALFHASLVGCALPFSRSPNLWSRTPPPSMFESLAIDSPYSLLSLKGSVKVLDTSRAKLVFSVLKDRVGITVAVDRDDTVGVFRHHFTVGVHAESPDHVVVLVSLIYEFAFIYPVGDVFEYLCRKFHPYSYIDTVLGLPDAELVAYGAEPFGAGTAGSQHQIAADIFSALCIFYPEAAVIELFHLVHVCVELASGCRLL